MCSPKATEYQGPVVALATCGHTSLFQSHAELINETTNDALWGLSVTVNAICGNIDGHTEDSREKVHRLTILVSHRSLELSPLTDACNRLSYR